MSEKMREEFEQFVIRRDGQIWVTVIGDQRSYNEPIERDFELWQASREALVIELPDEQPMYMYYAPDVLAAIEAAGLKVTP